MDENNDGNCQYCYQAGLHNARCLTSSQCQSLVNSVNYNFATTPDQCIAAGAPDQNGPNQQQQSELSGTNIFSLLATLFFVIVAIVGIVIVLLMKRLLPVPQSKPVLVGNNYFGDRGVQIGATIITLIITTFILAALAANEWSTAGTGALRTKFGPLNMMVDDTSIEYKCADAGKQAVLYVPVQRWFICSIVAYCLFVCCCRSF
jgi:hypothetical protein